MKLFKYILILSLAFTISQYCSAQKLLKQKISIDVEQKNTEVVMLTLEKLADFNFSYQNKLVDLDRMVSIHERQKSLRYILDLLFNNELNYKVIGSHIILQSKNPEQQKDHTIWIISGKVSNQKGEPLENVILYEINNKAAYVTNADGKYNLRLKGKSPLGITISCKGYRDTVAYIHPSKQQKYHFHLSPHSVETIAFKETPVFATKSLNWNYTNKNFEDFDLVQLMVSTKALYLSRNLETKENKIAQLSFLPNMGTNNYFKGIYTNNFSINILGGYSSGLNGFEAGGIANILNENMNGFQAAGISNIVGNHVNGVQAAGIVNTNLGNLNGVQFSGIINRVKGDIKGLQISGTLNTAAAKIHDTIQNIGWNGQISGGMNFYGGKGTNLQIAGIYNRSNNCSGIQIAGIANNVKGNMKGVQIAGIYNRTEKLNGVQVGIINHADTIANGFPLGLINIIKNGYQVLELSTDECFYLNTAYKTGGRVLYSFLKLGFGKYLNAAYGVGITTNPTKKLSLNFDLSGSALFNTDGDYSVFAGDLYRAQLGINYQLTSKLGLFTGPSFNFCSPNKKQKQVPTSDLSSLRSPHYGNYYLDKAVSSLKNQFWLGWQLGVRF